MNQLKDIFEKLQHKKHVWRSIIRAIETAIQRLRQHAKTSNDDALLSSICQEIVKAQHEYAEFEHKLKTMRSRLTIDGIDRAGHEHKGQYFALKKDLNFLNTEAQLAIEQLREIAKDIVDITATPTVADTRILHMVPPTPPCVENRKAQHSNDSSPSSTILRQKNEISEIRKQIEKLRTALPHSHNVNRVHIDDREHPHITQSVLNTSNEFENKIQKELEATWTKLDAELGKNANANSIDANAQPLNCAESFGNEATTRKLRSKLERYQEMTTRATDLCRSSVKVISAKNRDLVEAVAKNATVRHQWMEAKKEIEAMRSKENEASAMMENKWRAQCDINGQLQRENASLKRDLADMQGGFQSEINALKRDLHAQVKRQQNDISQLWKELQADDQVVKLEITEIIHKHKARRKTLFESAKN